MTKIFFAIEIKKYACARSKKLFSIESFPEWKTALNFPYDANTPRNITLKYVFYIRFTTDVLLKAKHKWLMSNTANKKIFSFEIIKYILEENQLLEAVQKIATLCQS